jgi:hypothetical protein
LHIFLTFREALPPFTLVPRVDLQRNDAQREAPQTLATSRTIATFLVTDSRARALSKAEQAPATGAAPMRRPAAEELRLTHQQQLKLLMQPPPRQHQWMMPMMER